MKSSAKLGRPCRVGSTTQITTCMVVEELVSKFTVVEIMARERQRDNESMTMGCPSPTCQVSNTYLHVDDSKADIIYKNL